MSPSYFFTTPPSGSMSASRSLTQREFGKAGGIRFPPLKSNSMLLDWSMSKTPVGTTLVTSTSTEAHTVSGCASTPPSMRPGSNGSVPQRPRGLHAIPSGHFPRFVRVHAAVHAPAAQWSPGAHASSVTHAAPHCPLRSDSHGSPPPSGNSESGSELPQCTIATMAAEIVVAASIARKGLETREIMGSYLVPALRRAPHATRSIVRESWRAGNHRVTKPPRAREFRGTNP
jgi:hypothetical protein